MADVTTTTELQLSPEESGQIVTETTNGSAFMKTAKQGTITHHGKVKRSILKPTGQNFSVKEGADKIVLRTRLGREVVLPSKKAFIYVTTLEADEAAPEVAAAFINYAPGLFAEEYDGNVSGEVEDVDGNINPLAVDSTVALTSAADIKAAYGAYLATGKRPSHWVLSNALYGSVATLDDGESDRKLSNELLTNGTLLGLPVETYESSEVRGFLRDFSMDEWALVDNQVRVRIARDGNVTDYAGEEHNLTQQNKVAYILEGFYSWSAEAGRATVELVGPDADPAA